jgi:transcriptional regulator of acetoin/glycerol metabolism
VGDVSLRRRLDRVNSAAGATLHEDVAGTNGLGSVLAEGRPVQVVGPEHYIDGFQGFTCVGAPVRHPLGGQIEGIVTLAMRYEDSNELLFPLVLQVAEEIQGRMLLQATTKERMLLDAFLSTSRRSARAVVSVTDQLVITNPAAARVLDGVDHAALWELASRARRATGTRSATLALADGAEIAARLRPVDDGVHVFGAVIEFDAQPASAQARGTGSGNVHDNLPGLVGRSRAWRELAASARSLLAGDVPVVVSGERGTGKLSVLEAALSITVDGGSVGVVDAATEPLTGTRALLKGIARELARRDVLIVRHLEALSDEADAALAAILDASTGSRRVLATLTLADGQAPRPGSAALLDRLGAGRLTIPPLRARRDDLPELVAAFTRRHAGDGNVPRWTADAIGMLQRADWPGNIRQLETVVRGSLAMRRGPKIGVADLPKEIRDRTVHAGHTELERLELEAIRAALREHEDNKSRAARSLGISRSTLYRKLEAFALELR